MKRDIHLSNIREILAEAIQTMTVQFRLSQIFFLSCLTGSGPKGPTLRFDDEFIHSFFLFFVVFFFFFLLLVSLLFPLTVVLFCFVLLCFVLYYFVMFCFEILSANDADSYVRPWITDILGGGPIGNTWRVLRLFSGYSQVLFRIFLGNIKVFSGSLLLLYCFVVLLFLILTILFFCLFFFFFFFSFTI